MKHISLFSGIGGFDLAAEWAGWENIAWCEIDKFCQKVLKYHFPDSIGHEDIKKTDFTKYRGTIDIVSGGFPCQPYSLAGKRLGKEDDRHLFPEMLRAIREIQPKWVVGENVFGIVNWNGGLVFNEVQADLEAEGYEVQAYVLPAAGVNAPHRRDRVWFVAYSNDKGSGDGSGKVQNENEEIQQRNACTEFSDTDPGITSDTKSQQSEWVQFKQREFSEQEQRQFRGTSGEIGHRNVTDTNSIRFTREEYREKESGFTSKTCCTNNWQDFPTKYPVYGGNDGIPGELDGITFPKWRNESIKAYGNAIVPQVAYQIFKAINEYNKIMNYEP